MQAFDYANCKIYRLDTISIHYKNMHWKNEWHFGESRLYRLF